MSSTEHAPAAKHEDEDAIELGLVPTAGNSAETAETNTEPAAPTEPTAEAEAPAAPAPAEATSAPKPAAAEPAPVAAAAAAPAAAAAAAEEADPEAGATADAKKAPKRDFKRTDLTIAYRDVSKTVRIPEQARGYDTMITPLINMVQTVATLGANLRNRDFHRLDAISGVLKPGSMTLILAPPGHGKSTFLKVLSSRLEVSDGKISYNGFSSSEAYAQGCNTRRLAQYVDQVDEHMPLLTVTETLEFAHRVTASHYDEDRVHNTIRLLGLEECKNTILGNAIIRGVSGGQKRRVTLGEMLVGDACALFLDEYTNGLDSATSEDITRGLRNWVNETNGMVVTSLQQPTPGVYNIFDRVLILKDGKIIYEGPREDVEPYFASMGYICPDDVDICDFIIDCLSQPRVALDRLQTNERRAARQLARDGKPVPAPVTSWETHNGGTLLRAETPCVSTSLMVEHYKRSPFWKTTEAELEQAIPLQPSSHAIEHAPLMPSPETKAMYHTGYVLPFMTLFNIIFTRQWANSKRNMNVIIPRFTQAIIMGLLYGSLYWDIPPDNFYLRIAVLLICMTQVGFGSMVELATSVANNLIVFKQAGASFYPTYMFVLSAAVCGIPIFFVESALLSIVIYFMSNCVRDAGHFFIFYAIVILTCFLMSIWFRMLSAIARDEPSAHAIAGPSTGIFIMFGGLFVTLSNLPVWMRWMMWISPFSWSVRALANNEFLSSRYSEITDSGIPLGHLFLNQVDMKIGKEWIGYGAIYLFGFACLCLAAHSLLLYRPNFEASMGTTRFDDEPEMLDNDTDKEILADDEAHLDDPGLGSPVPAGMGEDAAADALGRVPSSVSDSSLVRGDSNANTLQTLREAVAFTPTWLTFSDVRYTVQVKATDGTNTMVDRPLLRGVNGYAEPGKLTALMGASGAGKTTLLDVLAGRKNMGVIEGKIMLNGRTATKYDIAKTTGYVEQFDSLLSTDTVRETLCFAAYLRLPADVPVDVKDRIVDEVLEILDLSTIANRLIGSKQIPGLSPSQLKRVNIGCELVANPAVLFLDEPTTGLDSRAAQTVMRVVRRIARSGRAVICTIHQPSAELFYLFDRLVLLASGGYQMYFGDLGERSRRFVRYLSAIPKVKPIPPRYNPASWMLEELGVGVSDAKADAEPTAVIVERFMNYYTNSRVRSAAMSKIRKIEALSEQAAPAGDGHSGAGAGEDGAIELQALPPAAAPDVLVPVNSALSAGPNGLIVDPIKIDVGGHGHHNDDNASEASGASFANQSVVSGASGVKRRDSISRVSQASAALPTALTTAPDYKAPSLLAQAAEVIKRAMRGNWRNPPMLMTRFMVLTILSILFGCIYFQLEVTTQSAATSLIAAVVVGAMFGSVTHSSSSLPGKISDRAVFYRETSSGMYWPTLWAIATLLCDILWCIPGSLILQIPMYFMMGLLNDASAFFKYFFAVYVFCLLFSSVATTAASISPNAPAANVIQGLFFSFAFTFAGIAIPYPQIPRGYVWLFRMLPISHLTEALAMPQFKWCTPLPECTPLIEIADGTGTKFIPIAQYVMDYLGFSFGYYWESLGWATLCMLVLWIIGFYATARLRFDQR